MYQIPEGKCLISKDRKCTNEKMAVKRIETDENPWGKNAEKHKVTQVKLFVIIKDTTENKHLKKLMAVAKSVDKC